MDIFLLFFILWVGITLIVAYLLSAHFLSSITIHILHLLHRLGWYSKSKEDWWEEFPEFESMSITTKDGKLHTIEWQDWFIMAFNDTWWQRMLADLLTCPICISFHLSFWVSTITILLTYLALPISPWVFALIPFYSFSIPPISLTIYNYVRRQHI